MNENPSPQLQSSDPDSTEPEKRFHGWRLIGFIMCIVVVIAVISAAVDWAVIGPLEGRAY